MSEYTAEAIELIRNRPGLAREVARQLARNQFSQAKRRPAAITFGLTPAQAELLNFIRTHYREHGLSPTYREMMKAVGQASLAGVHRLVCALEERGHIARMPGRQQSIVLRDDMVAA